MPKGTVAPGYVCPCPPVPILIFTNCVRSSWEIFVGIASIDRRPAISRRNPSNPGRASIDPKNPLLVIIGGSHDTRVRQIALVIRQKATGALRSERFRDKKGAELEMCSERNILCWRNCMYTDRNVCTGLWTAVEHCGFCPNDIAISCNLDSCRHRAYRSTKLRASRPRGRSGKPVFSRFFPRQHQMCVLSWIVPYETPMKTARKTFIAAAIKHFGPTHSTDLCGPGRNLRCQGKHYSAATGQHKLSTVKFVRDWRALSARARARVPKSLAVARIQPKEIAHCVA